MPLTDMTARAAKPKENQYKLTDERGLHLLIHPNGSKYWRLKYRFAGKEKVLALGVYPEVSLKEARDSRDVARKLLRDGVDPSEAKKEEKRQQVEQITNSFESIALEWHELQAHRISKRHADNILKRLVKEVFPAIGARAVPEITAPELLAVLRPIESRGAIDICHRVHQICGQIFRYAIATGRAERDVSGDLRGALKTRKQKNYARLEEKELPEFLSKLEAYDGDLQTKLALKLVLHTFVRTTELRGARWEEIDFEKAEWRIPATRMKARELHIVPLSRQAINILKELQPLSGHREYIFPNRNKPLGFMSENTMLFALYRMGYHSRTTVHGFRGTASTILNENGFRPDWIERQLAHAERNSIRAAYNHAQYLPERKKMMQFWSDHLVGAAQGAGNIIAGKFGATC